MSEEGRTFAEIRFGVRCAVGLMLFLNALTFVAIVTGHPVIMGSILIPDVAMLALGVLIWLRYGPLRGWDS